MKERFLVVAAFPDSILKFRGPLLSALLCKGLEVHVAAPGLGQRSSFRYELEEKGFIVHDIQLVRTGMNPFKDAATFIQLWTLMLRICPRYALGYTVKPTIYGSLAAWLARVPHRFALITGLGYAFQGEGRRGLLERLVSRLYATALSRTHKVFFQNPDDEALFRNRGILSISIASQVVNGSGVDVSEFAPIPLGGPPICFLLIARLLGDKGVREYVAAAAQVKKDHPSVQFSLVGWIDNNPDAISQQELDAWVAAGTIHYIGRLDDVRPAIQRSSVYVLPSYREGTPRTVLEAMAMGRAVITTDAPGCRETVIDGVNGFLVPVRCAAALAEAMLRFVEQPELAAEMGQQARKLAEEKYDVRKVNAVMLREMNIQ